MEFQFDPTKPDNDYEKLLAEGKDLCDACGEPVLKTELNIVNPYADEMFIDKNVPKELIDSFTQEQCDVCYASEYQIIKSAYC